jgi:hypothetical protein
MMITNQWRGAFTNQSIYRYRGSCLPKPIHLPKTPCCIFENKIPFCNTPVALYTVAKKNATPQLQQPVAFFKIKSLFATSHKN